MQWHNDNTIQYHTGEVWQEEREGGEDSLAKEISSSWKLAGGRNHEDSVRTDSDWKGNLARVPGNYLIEKTTFWIPTRLYRTIFWDNTKIWSSSNLKNINISDTPKKA